MSSPIEIVRGELKKLTDSINTRAILNEAEKFYHPAAVFTNTNDGTSFLGLNNIQEAYGRFLNIISTIQFGPEEFYQTNKDAKYVVVHGRFTVDTSTEQYSFNKVYLADINGFYKIYHDEINFKK